MTHPQSLAKTAPLYPRYLFRKHLALRFLDEVRTRPSGTRATHGKDKSKATHTARFLEIGAGRGDFSRALLQRYESGVVLDFSAEAVKQAQKNLEGTSAEVIRGDILTHSFHQKFSLIAILEVLEHIRDDALVLRKIHSLLDTDGLLLLSVPARMKYWSASDEAVGHYRRYERATLRTLLEDKGFEIVREASYGFPFLNLVAIVRNLFFAHTLRATQRTVSSHKETRSRESGLGFFHRGRFSGVTNMALRVFFSPRAVAIMTWLSTPFHTCDLGDGYLLLLRKRAQ